MLAWGMGGAPGAAKVAAIMEEEKMAVATVEAVTVVELAASEKAVVMAGAVKVVGKVVAAVAVTRGWVVTVAATAAVA